MAPRWTLRPVEDEAAVAALAAQLNDLPPALARALVVRGVGDFDTARSFFRDGLEAVHDPFLMRDMDRAASRLAEAVARRERVMVYGDYDVDGTTATALMTGFLRAQGVEATFFIPSRFEHGYGLCREGLDEAVERGASLVVALDCGITGVEEARYAKEALGLDLIICDHHEPGPELPDATAVLDPKRADCPYPFTGLSGCGVGFKLVQATLDRLGRPAEEAHPYLDLVAVSIAADIVPVVGENRMLMRAGLRRLATHPRLGLQALAEVAGTDLAQATTSRIVFQLGPRINAAGRMGSAERAAHLFLTDDPAEARRIAEELERVNAERKLLDRATLAEALEDAEALMLGAPLALVLHRPHWHGGVIGIVAARIAERYHRPAILLRGDGALVRGSARSVGGISIHDALGACGDHIIGFGGHDAAAGVSLELANLDAFRAALHEAVGAAVEPEELVPEVPLDAALDLADLDVGLHGRFWQVLQQFGPFGPQNPRPVFWGRDLRAVGPAKAVGQDKSHLRLRVAQRAGGPVYPVIGFGLGERLEEVERSGKEGHPLELAFCLEENRWNGRTELQLEAKDVRVMREEL